MTAKVLMLKNLALCLCKQVRECVHVPCEPYVILMQQHGMQHPRPQDAQHAAFVRNPSKVALQCQLDMSCVTAKCKRGLKLKLVIK